MDISAHEEGFSAMQAVKRRFFALRNGIISDTLRKAGSPFSIIFGLNLPQIKEIAAYAGKDRALAEALWANTTTRESMMLAPFIFPEEEYTRDMARTWLSDCPSAEISDTLCHALLRHMPYAAELAFEILDSHDGSPQTRYGALRLMLNILPALDRSRARETAERERRNTDSPTTSRLAVQLTDELDFLEGKF